MFDNKTNNKKQIKEMLNYIKQQRGLCMIYKAMYLALFIITPGEFKFILFLCSFYASYLGFFPLTQKGS